MKKSPAPLIPLMAASLILSACATTTFISKWKDPETTTLDFDKVLVVAQTPDESLRRAVEDTLVRRIRGSVASYTLLSKEEVRDVNAAKAKIAAGGYDGAVVFRLIGVDQQMSYVPGTSMGYGTFWGYYPMGFYDPGYMREDQIVRIETLVYDVGKDKLVWAGQSETMNPVSAEKLALEIAEAVAQEMRKQKLIS